MCRFATFIRIATSIFLLTTMLSDTILGQDHDPALQERFLTGVSQAAQKLERLSLRVKCVRTTQYNFDSSQSSVVPPERRAELGKPKVTTFESAVRGLFGMQSGLSKTGNQYFRVRNSVYAFAIERTLETNRTSLQFVEQLGADPSVDEKVAEIEENVRGTALAAFHVRGKALSDLVKSPSFKIRRVYAVQAGGGELVRVEFDFGDAANPPKQHASFTYTDNFLVCDPGREWCLTEYGGLMHDHRSKEDSMLNLTLGFGNSINGIPVATKVELTNSSPRVAGTTVTSTHTMEVMDQDVPAQEFYLTHYGLPEPNFSRGGNRSWLVYLIGGVACLGIGAILIKRRNGRVNIS